MRRLVVVALSARALAEAAAREGFEVIALDVFGDADTRRASRRWQPIGDASSMRIDEALLRAALQRVARDDEAPGWMAGSGFEGRPAMLEAAAQCLPLIGTGTDALCRVRDARTFFDVLRAHGIAHPPVLHAGPAPGSGWLLKDAAGCGGQQVRWADAATAHAPGGTRYLQQWREGTPMSATWIADGRRAVALGCNRQLVQARGAAPFAWHGVVGPVAVGDDVRRQVDAALQVLVAAFGLRGVGSLDFLLDATQRIEVLEVNARWPGSAELYSRAGWPLVGAQVQQRLLPASLASTAPRGIAVVHAQRALRVGADALQWLGAQGDVHDVPAAASTVGPLQPVCSVSADGIDAGEVERTLAQRRAAVLSALEQFQ